MIPKAMCAVWQCRCSEHQGLFRENAALCLTQRHVCEATGVAAAAHAVRVLVDRQRLRFMSTKSTSTPGSTGSCLSLSISCPRRKDINGLWRSNRKSHSEKRSSGIQTTIHNCSIPSWLVGGRTKTSQWPCSGGTRSSGRALKTSARQLYYSTIGSFQGETQISF